MPNSRTKKPAAPKGKSPRQHNDGVQGVSKVEDPNQTPVESDPSGRDHDALGRFTPDNDGDDAPAGKSKGRSSKSGGKKGDRDSSEGDDRQVAEVDARHEANGQGRVTDPEHDGRLKGNREAGSNGRQSSAGDSDRVHDLIAEIESKLRELRDLVGREGRSGESHGQETHGRGRSKSGGSGRLRENRNHNSDERDREEMADEGAHNADELGGGGRGASETSDSRSDMAGASMPSTSENMPETPEMAR